MGYGTIVADKITTSDGYTLGGSGASMRNRVINGDMRIDQRNAGANSLPTITSYSTVDRFIPNMGTGSKFSLQQSNIAPPGFTNSLKVVSTAATTIGASDYYALQYRNEGYNISDFAWGTSDAATATLSFWVRSSLTGTFGAALRSGSASYWSYAFNYTISAADTWEQKIITIPGPTSGAASYPADNTDALSIWFGFGVGSDNTLAAGTWTNVNKLGATGSVNLCATQGATWYLTGLQLEKGSVATSFDYRSIATELALCQRYYFKTNDVNTATGANGAPMTGVGSSTNGCIVTGFRFPVQMRTTPTWTFSSFNGTAGVWSNAANNNDTAAATVNGSSASGLQQVVVSGLTTGQPYYAYGRADAEV